MIQYIAQGVKMPEIKKRKLNGWIKTVAEQHGKIVGELAYIFSTDEDMLKINTRYLNHDYYTDIITFDYGHEMLISGDIFIGTETVKSNADKYSVSFDEELHRVIIHGVLHLCGQNDGTAEERIIMKNKENQALEQLKKMF